MITIDTIEIKQPSPPLNEADIQIQTDKEAIDGSLQRDRLGAKKSVTMSWDWLTPTEYQELLGLFSSGDAVDYKNTQSNRAGGTYEFTGLPTFREGDYLRGSSLWRGLEVTIREV